MSSIKITIEIDTDNAAFGEGPEERGCEAGRILDQMMTWEDDLSDPEWEGMKLRDFNGNTVGNVIVEREDEE